jgi:hypothetical protein
MIPQLLVLTDRTDGAIPITPFDTKVWTCAGCGVQLTSADLHGTSAESVLDHADDCSEMAKVKAAALRAFADELVLSPVAALLAREAANELEAAP